MSSPCGCGAEPEPSCLRPGGGSEGSAAEWGVPGVGCGCAQVLGRGVRCPGWPGDRRGLRRVPPAWPMP